MRNTYGLLDYTTMNIGDWVQSIATLQFLPRIDFLYQRDTGDLSVIRDDLSNEAFKASAKNIIYNAWITDFARFEKAAAIENILFTSLHIGDYFPRLDNGKYDAAAGRIRGFDRQFSELRKITGTIGARDCYSRDQIKKNGINSFLSYCNTLSLNGDSIDYEQRDGVYLVDINSPDILEKIPEHITKEATRTKHEAEDYRKASFNGKLQKAIDLLKGYNKAKLVITSRLHSALPCLAFGTPVIYICKKEDKRIKGTYEELFDHMIDRSEVDTLKTIRYEDFVENRKGKERILEIREATRKLLKDFLVSSAGIDLHNEGPSKFYEIEHKIPNFINEGTHQEPKTKVYNTFNTQLESDDLKAQREDKVAISQRQVLLRERPQVSTSTELNKYPDLYEGVANISSSIHRSNPEVNILVIGFSTGEEPFTIADQYFNQSHHRIYAGDMNEDAIQSATKNYSHARIRYFNTRLNNPLEFCSYDIAFVNTVLCRFPDSTNLARISGSYPYEAFESTLKELNTMLRLPGLLVVYNASYRLCDTSLNEYYSPIAIKGLENSGDVIKLSSQGEKLPNQDYKYSVFLKHK